MELTRCEDVSVLPTSCTAPRMAKQYSTQGSVNTIDPETVFRMENLLSFLGICLTVVFYCVNVKVC